MSVVALGGRALLVLVFTAAAVGKLVDRDGARRALGEFRVPAALVGTISWLLPLTELLVAALLLVQPVAREAAAASALLLAMFIAGISAAMRRGEAPDCNCFGQIGSKPAGGATLARNALLAAVAVFVTVFGAGTDPGTWFKAQMSAEAAVLGLVMVGLILAAALGSLVAREGVLKARLKLAESTLALFPPGLPTGVAAPAFSLPRSDGATVTLGDLLMRGHPVALTFVSPSCMPCKYMFPDISTWQQSLAEQMTIALVVHGTAGDAREMGARFGLSNLLVDPDGEVFRAYRGTATPSMLIINADGTVATRIRSSQGVVEAALRTALRASMAVAEVGPDDATSLLQVERWPGRDVQLSA